MAAAAIVRRLALLLLLVCQGVLSFTTAPSRASSSPWLQSRQRRDAAAASRLDPKQFSGGSSSSSHSIVLLHSAAIMNDSSSISTAIKDDASNSIDYQPNVIVGGGPAGLLAAIMLAQQQKEPTGSASAASTASKTTPYIHVYDRQMSAAPSPDDTEAWQSNANIAKYYLIGLGGRGQAALKQLGVWDDVLRHCVAVVGRKDWAPGASAEQGVERVFTAKDKKTTAQILPREKLVAILQQVIQERFSSQIQIHYASQVDPVDFNYQKGDCVLLQVTQCVPAANDANSNTKDVAADTVECPVDASTRLLQTSLVIAADGTQRTFANAMELVDQQARAAMNPFQKLLQRPFRVKRYVDDNQRVYKTIPMKLPQDWRCDLNYSARTAGSRINLDALPANDKGDYCAVLLLMHDDPFAKADTDPLALREWMKEYLPQFSPLLSDDTIAAVAKKPVSMLPSFRYVGPRLNQGNRCIILGDCAHTVKPYFGLGANSALEDVLIFGNMLEQFHGDVTMAVPEFSRQRAPEAKTLVRLSRELDRPGKLGFVTFILPIILDSIFSGLAPKLFTPNLIAMMQREEYTFTQVARRKRLDRILQVAIIGSGLAATGWTMRLAIRSLAAALHQSVATTFALSMAVVATVTTIPKLVPALAPRALVAALAGKIINSRTHLTPLRKLLSRGEARNGESFLTPLGFKNKDGDKKDEAAPPA